MLLISVLDSQIPTSLPHFQITHDCEEPVAVVRLLRCASSMPPRRLREMGLTDHLHSAHGPFSKELVEVSSGGRPAQEDLYPAESPTNRQANAHPADPRQDATSP